MPLAGTQLRYRDVYGLARSAGWREPSAIIAVAVCAAESARYTEAYNPDNPDGSTDYGLYQINSVHFGQTLGGVLVTKEACLDPARCSKIAHAIYQSQGWRPWVAYTNGRYHDFLDDACKGQVNYWRDHFGIPTI